MFRFPYRWTWGTVWRNLRFAHADISNGVRNLIRWAPVIWFDCDFDWSYLATMMEKKLRWSADLEERCGHHVGSKLDARQMRVCADILKRLMEDQYYENAVKRFGETTTAAKFSHEHSKSDQRYLGLILGKYLTHWWD